MKEYGIYGLMVALVAGAFFAGIACKSADKANERYTENCHNYVLHLSREKRYLEAVTANCLCQQSAKQSDQNLCKGLVRTVIADFIRTQCAAEPDKSACQRWFQTDLN